MTTVTVTVIGYGPKGAVLYAEQCNDMEACDIKEEMLCDTDVVLVECLEDDPMLVYAFGD